MAQEVGSADNQLDTNAERQCLEGTKDISAVEIGYKLHSPVENNLYEYIAEQTV